MYENIMIEMCQEPQNFLQMPKNCEHLRESAEMHLAAYFLKKILSEFPGYRDSSQPLESNALFVFKVKLICYIESSGPRINARISCIFTDRSTIKEVTQQFYSIVTSQAKFSH